MPDHPFMARLPPLVPALVPALEMPPLAPLEPRATVAAPPVVSTNVAAAMAALEKAQEEVIYSEDEWQKEDWSDEDKPEGEEEAEGKDWVGAEEDFYKD